MYRRTHYTHTKTASAKSWFCLSFFWDVSKYNGRLNLHAGWKCESRQVSRPDVGRDTSLQCYNKFTALIFFKLEVCIFIVVAALILTECHSVIW